MLRQRQYRTIYQFVIAIWLTLSIASVLLAAISWVRLSQSIAAGRQWGNVGPKVDEILKTMLDSETGVWGFIITGNSNYLGPYIAAQKDYKSQFDSLADMTTGNTNLLKAVVDLRAQSEMLADYNRRVVEARMRDFHSAQALTLTGEGRLIMDQIRAQVSALDKVYYDQVLDV